MFEDVQAEKLQARLEVLHRRERELTALYDTARDLAALRDLDGTLRAIVRRARALLGTDVTYLTLVDEQRGDTEMRVTDGSVSARFQRVRLPLGAGLGGLVAETGQPYASAEYFPDKRFRHTGDIDTAVREEGLVAILGVPLALGAGAGQGHQVIGVLFAADRSARPFAPDEALLASLASLAAVAIDSARLLDQTGRRLRELDAAGAAARAHSAAVERAADAHDQLTSLVLAGGGIDDLARAVADLLGGNVLIRDTDGRSLAGVGEVVGPGDPPGEQPWLARRAGDSWLVCAVAGEELLGELVRRILERAAMVTALLLLIRRSAAAADEQVRGELLTDLLVDPERDLVSVQDRARRLEVNLDSAHCVVVATAEVARQRIGKAAAHHARALGGLAVQHDGAAVLLLPGRDASALARHCVRGLSTILQRQVTAGVAGPVCGPSAIPAAHREAQRCLRALVALGRGGEAASADELGFVGLLLADRADPGGFVRSVLGPVLDYDARRGTDLVTTLRVYFAEGRSPARAKDNLNVHVNTVVQRLERITGLLGPDWQHPERTLQVELALRLLDLLPPQGSL
jgi:DNA-binding PucR family transcriptional regulator